MKQLEVFITPSLSPDQPPRDHFTSSPSIFQTPAITHSAVPCDS